MAFCTSCGATIADHAQFCTSCGAKSAAPVSPGGGAAAAPAPASQGSGNALKIILIVIGSVVLIGILATAAVTIFIGKKIHDAGVGVVEKEGEAKISLPGVNIETTQDEGKVAKDLGIDLYPGATMAQGAGAMQFGNMSATNAVFETDDSPEQVAAFYRERLPGAHYTAAQGTHTIIGREGDDMITVHVEQQDGKTRITLARTSGMETN